MPTLKVEPLSKTNESDFFAVHCEKNGEGWCNCVAWWTPSWDGWGERTKEQNLHFRKELFNQDKYDGYLLYEDSKPVAWCQVGQRDRLKKLVEKYKLPPSPKTWAVTCFVVPPQCRGKRYAQTLLEGALEHLKEIGVSHVQAFPKAGEGLEPREMWTGPVGLYLNAGFRIERDHEQLPVYGLSLGE
jgi:GNAT superfamily N-acetyltransferase